MTLRSDWQRTSLENKTAILRRKRLLLRHGSFESKAAVAFTYLGATFGSTRISQFGIFWYHLGEVPRDGLLACKTRRVKSRDCWPFGGKVTGVPWIVFYP